jgi:hypothetical protein
MLSTFKRFHQDAKLTIYYAAMIAAHAKQRKIGATEILLALTWREHTPDCSFRKLKDDFQQIWSASGYGHFPISVVPYKPAAKDALALDDPAKRVLAHAVFEADRSNDYWIDIDHIMRGLLKEGGPSAAILQSTGWTIETVTAEGRDGRKKYPPKEVPLLRKAAWRYMVWLRRIGWH